MTFFNDKKTNLSRRNLLKGLGACAALPLLGGIFPKSALAQAISAAGSTEPDEVGEALARLDLGPADGVSGPDLDFSRAQAFVGETTALYASDQQLGLRPQTVAGQLVWFTAPDSP